MLDAYPDAHIAWHTDFPWSSINPLHHLYSLVTMNEIAGDMTECADPDWIGNKTLSIEEALRMMTIEAAYSLFREDEVGSLEVGKYADLIIISGDLTSNFKAIKDHEVVMTMVGGEVRWCAPGFEQYCP
jgi:predicted amidohydrolase YtcJ